VIKNTARNGQLACSAPWFGSAARANSGSSAASSRRHLSARVATKSRCAQGFQTVTDRDREGVRHPDSKQITALVAAIATSENRDCAWTPDGTLLMVAGTKIFAWRPRDSDWREVYHANPHGLGTVSRIAIAPDGKAMATVVAEK
jgi:hypothetical protein